MQPPAKDTYPITYYVSQNEASVSQRKKKKRNVCPYRAGLFFNDVLRRNSSGEWVCAPVKGRLAKHPVVLEAQRFTLREANLDAEHIAEVACALYPQMLALQELKDGVFMADINVNVDCLKTMPSSPSGMRAVPSLSSIHYADCQSAPEFMRWTVAKLRHQLHVRRIGPAEDRVIFACAIRYSLEESCLAALEIAVALDGDVAKRLRSVVREKIEHKAMPAFVVTDCDRPPEIKSVEVVAGWRFQLVGKGTSPLDSRLDTLDELGSLMLSHTALCAGDSCSQNLKDDLASTTWAYKLCSRCKFARFCSDECFKIHWKQHKTVCDKLCVVADHKGA